MIIENFDELASSPLRKQALIIAEAGLGEVKIKKIESPLSQISGRLVSTKGSNKILTALHEASATVEEIQTVLMHLPNALEFGEFTLTINETKTKPETTMYQAEEILSKYKILETTSLSSTELVKESSETLSIEIVSLNNITRSMKQKAEDLGWRVSVEGETNILPQAILANSRKGFCGIGINSTLENLDTVLKILPFLNKQVFLTIDPEYTNDAAGCIVDNQTLLTSKKLYLNPEDCMANHDSYHFLEATSDLIFTNPPKTDLLGFFVCLTEK